MHTIPPFLPGDHLKVWVSGYYHHGIYIGNGWVIHFTGLTRGKRNATIRLGALERFGSGAVIEVVEYAHALPPAEVVARAWSRVDQDGYNVFMNNCEHFARWCKTGEHVSDQSRSAVAHAAGVGAGGTVAAATVGAVSTAGLAAAASGPAIMKGLAAAGGLVGGGAAAGLPVVGALPGVIAAAAMNHAYKDDPALPQAERDARMQARTGAAVGVGVGTAGAVAAVAAAGVPGLSAVGITTGLAAIGGAVGGGMLAGVAVAAGAPVVLAIGLGRLLYSWRAKR